MTRNWINIVLSYLIRYLVPTYIVSHLFNYVLYDNLNLVYLELRLVKTLERVLETLVFAFLVWLWSHVYRS